MVPQTAGPGHAPICGTQAPRRRAKPLAVPVLELRGFGASGLRGFGASGLRGFGASGLRGFGASGLSCFCCGVLCWAFLAAFDCVPPSHPLPFEDLRRSWLSKWYPLAPPPPPPLLGFSNSAKDFLGLAAQSILKTTEKGDDLVCLETLGLRACGA